MDLQSAIQSEISQKEKNKWCILTHECGTSEKWYRRTLFYFYFCRAGVEMTDVEKGHVNTVGGGELGDWVDVHAASCVRQTASGACRTVQGAQLRALR